MSLRQALEEALHAYKGPVSRYGSPIRDRAELAAHNAEAALAAIYKAEARVSGMVEALEDRVSTLYAYMQAQEHAIKETATEYAARLEALEAGQGEVWQELRNMVREALQYQDIAQRQASMLDTCSQEAKSLYDEAVRLNEKALYLLNQARGMNDDDRIGNSSKPS